MSISELETCLNQRIVELKLIIKDNANYSLKLIIKDNANYSLKNNEHAILLINLSRDKFPLSDIEIICEIKKLIRETSDIIDKKSFSHMLRIFEERSIDIRLQKEINNLISEIYSYICIYDLENAYESLSLAHNKASLIKHKDINDYKEPEYFIKTIEIIKNELILYRERYNNLHLCKKQSIFNCFNSDYDYDLLELYKKYWYKFDQRDNISFKKDLKRAIKYRSFLFYDYEPSRLPSDIINKCLIGTIYNDKIKEQEIPTASIVDEIKIKN